MTNREDILCRVKERGGLLGYAASHYMHDKENGDKFIIECFEQCHNQSAVDFWGEELVLDIIKYAVHLKNLEIGSKPQRKWVV